MYNRESSFYNPFMTFLSVVTKSDCLPVYFSLFWLEVCLCSQIANALCFSLAAEDKKADSILMRPWSLWALMSSAYLIFLRFEFIQIIEVLVKFLTRLVEKNQLKLKMCVLPKGMS